ncbi:hypothetical protein NX794_28465 [Streptomyces sp. LP11]|uniref:Secreted protein n=1 Tax=Streptomyces pyxinicus TaxID=2970331 RepID=A0ABT2B9C8_9ACTN|nr:hypothetical protein [Streptomyces sp. LP11]MCS0605114.1 hypothetical protein [Streptomyces sp. LP11]
MHVDWPALARVAAVSLGVTVAVVVVFTLGVLGLSHTPTDTDPTPTVAGRTQAALCFLACGAVVGYGIYLIVPQFH